MANLRGVGQGAHRLRSGINSIFILEGLGAPVKDWVEKSLVPVRDQAVAVDGKTARRSVDRGNRQSALHLTSAGATETRAQEQVKVAGHAIEIVTVPALVERVVLPSAVVTLDAMGYQRRVAGMIMAAGAATCWR